MQNVFVIETDKSQEELDVIQAELCEQYNVDPASVRFITRDTYDSEYKSQEDKLRETLASMALPKFPGWEIEIPKASKPYPPDEHLDRKGLKRFTINGKEIIARNEREANKRYKHRYK